MKKRISSLLLILTLLLSSPIYAEPQSATNIEDFYQILYLIQENYAYDIEESQLIEGAIKGLFYNLDEYSDYYTKEEMDILLEDLSGDFVGIGVYIKEEEGNIIITDIIKNSPAQSAGLKSGDIILEVNGQDIKGLNINEVSKLIKGEIGTKVNIKIKRAKEIKNYNIIRNKIKVKVVESKILEKNIGYIKLNQFSEGSHKEIQKALKDFDNKKIKNIILDLRNNPGGLLSEAANVSNLFIPEGPIVHIKYKNGKTESYYSNLKKTKYNLVVLVNENSASASEIVVAAIKDTKAGTIIGTPTYGKGTVQSILGLPKGEGMKLTIAEYQSPKGNKINGIGVKPDIVVENEGEKDLQLKKAISVLPF